jgi:hypothetical protein
MHALASPLLEVRAGKSLWFTGKSGRSKKGGAGTSVRLRKLRGRSTTFNASGPSIRRAVCFSPRYRACRLTGQAALSNDDPILIGVDEVPWSKRHAGEAHRNRSFACSAFPAAHR